MLRNMIISFLRQKLIFQDTITFPELFPIITGMLFYIRKNLINGRFSNKSYYFNCPFQFNTKFSIYMTFRRKSKNLSMINFVLNLINGRFSNNSDYFNFPFQFNTKFIIDRFFDFLRKVIYFLSCSLSIIYQD